MGGADLGPRSDLGRLVHLPPARGALHLSRHGRAVGSARRDQQGEAPSARRCGADRRPLGAGSAGRPLPRPAPGPGRADHGARRMAQAVGSRPRVPSRSGPTRGRLDGSQRRSLRRGRPVDHRRQEPVVLPGGRDPGRIGRDLGPERPGAAARRGGGSLPAGRELRRAQPRRARVGDRHDSRTSARLPTDGREGRRPSPDRAR